MAKVRSSRVKIIRRNGRLITLLLIAQNRRIQISESLFKQQKKLGIYKVIEDKTAQAI